MQSTHRPLIPAVWESFRFVCTQALTERASEKAPARKMQPKKVTSSKSLSLQTSNYSVNVDQWKVKRTEGRSKRGKEHLVRSLHENPNKPGNKQTNKHKMCIQLHPKLYFILKRQKTKEQRQRGEWPESFSWEQRSWESFCHVKMSGWTFYQSSNYLSDSGLKITRFILRN